MRKGRYFDRDYRIIQPDGEIRWVHSRNFPVLDKQGTVYRVIGIAEDITERKLAESALRENEEKYRAIFDNAIVGVYQTTPNGRFISANMAFARMYGYADPGELLAKQDNVAVQMYADANTRTEVLRILNEHGVIDSHEMPVRRKDGSVFWISLTTRMVKDREGTLLWYEGTQVDITRRKLAEQSLAENEAKFRTLVEASPDMIWEIDTHGNFTYISPQCRVQARVRARGPHRTTVFFSHQARGRFDNQDSFLEHVQDKRSYSMLEVPAHDKEGNQITIEIRSVPCTGI